MSKKRKFSGNPLLNNLERSTRIELVPPTWKDGMLPLHQERPTSLLYYILLLVVNSFIEWDSDEYPFG